MIETTFAMIKSKAVRDGLTGYVMGRIIVEKFDVNGLTMRSLTEREISFLYYEHRERAYYSDLVNSVSGEVVIMTLMRKNAIQHWRETIGPSDPKKAPLSTLRAMAFNEPRMADNVVHGSDSLESALRERRLFGYHP